MKFSIQIFLTTLLLQAASVYSAPLAAASNATTTEPTVYDDGPMDFAPMTEKGCSCYYWKVKNSDNKSALKVKCDTIGAGLIIRGSSAQLGNTAWFWQPGGTYTTPWTNAPDTDPDFKLEYSWSGNSDMGDCSVQLIRTENWFKDYFNVRLSCSKISPWIQARGRLHRPADFVVRSPWITSAPQTVDSDTWRSWYGSPDVSIEWALRD